MKWNKKIVLKAQNPIVARQTNSTRAYSLDNLLVFDSQDSASALVAVLRYVMMLLLLSPTNITHSF